MLIREANISDGKKILNIRNHESIRILSKNNSIIELNDHIKWFDVKINDILKGFSKDIFLVLEEGEKLIGYIRLDNIEEKKYLLSIAILPEGQGKGYGNRLFEKVKMYLKKGDIIIAEILRHNNNSIKFFEKLGFLLLSKDNEKYIYKYIINND